MAEPPKSSLHPRPNPRPEFTGSAPATLHPLPRPASLSEPVVEPVLLASTALPRPMARPLGLARQVPAAAKKASKPAKSAKPSLKGSVCGDADIRGQSLPSIGSKTKGCGLADPVKVTSIAGVGFSQAATIDCPTAKALKKWMAKGMQPAFGNRQVVKLHIYGSYACRPRNNLRGGKISEHGRGKAIDIAGFIFADGSEWTVARDYNKTIRKAQKAACGIFGTTLGPGSDGYHEDHLHFDTAKRGNGAYCR